MAGVVELLQAVIVQPASLTARRAFLPVAHGEPMNLRLLPLLLIMLAGLMLGNVSSAVDFNPRPCGPSSMQGPLRYLIPQGVAGADFRPACRRHDACYGVPGVDRNQCDKQFLRDMQCACKNSRHPICCRITARLMYAATRVGAGEAFERSQIGAFRFLRRGR